MMQKANEEAQRNERIALGTNRSTFLHLGDKKQKLVCESESSLLQRQKGPVLNSNRSRASTKASSRAEVYMTDAQRKD